MKKGPGLSRPSGVGEHRAQQRAAATRARANDVAGRFRHRLGYHGSIMQRCYLSTRSARPRNLPFSPQGENYASCPSLARADCRGAAFRSSSGAGPTTGKRNNVESHDDQHKKGYHDYDEGARRAYDKIDRLLQAGGYQGAAWQTAQELHVELQEGLSVRWPFELSP